ncbi:hypothetical protein SGRIM119S_08469 [Streptomyces griseorubiginosus]
MAAAATVTPRPPGPVSLSPSSVSASGCSRRWPSRRGWGRQRPASWAIGGIIGWIMSAMGMGMPKDAHKPLVTTKAEAADAKS